MLVVQKVVQPHWHPSVGHRLAQDFNGLGSYVSPLHIPYNMLEHTPSLTGEILAKLLVSI
jgi:hypothetical protein